MVKITKQYTNRENQSTDARSLEAGDRTAEAVLDRLRDREDRFSKIVDKTSYFYGQRFRRRGYVGMSPFMSVDEARTMLVGARRAV